MVYIVTPNDDRNYGAVLQATALQRTLRDLGIDSRFVTVKKNLDRVLQISLKNPKSAVKSLLMLGSRGELKTSCARFQDFVGKYQRCTETYPDYAALAASPLSAAVILSAAIRCGRKQTCCR